MFSSGRPKLTIGGMLRPIGIPTQKHMVTIGSPGSGKSTTALAVNLMVHDGSCLAIDPKGELARIAWMRRGPGGYYGISGMGQQVRLLDPFNVTRMLGSGRGSSYNVFDEMEEVAKADLARPVSYASTIADALAPENPGKSDRSGARPLIASSKRSSSTFSPLNRKKNAIWSASANC